MLELLNIDKVTVRCNHLSAAPPNPYRLIQRTVQTVWMDYFIVVYYYMIHDDAYHTSRLLISFDFILLLSQLQPVKPLR